MNVKSFVTTAVFLSLMISANAAWAQAPLPTGMTPTLYGGTRLDPGTFVMGVTTGYPETSFDVYFGLTQVFDLAIQAGFTYGFAVDGNRQGLGMDVHVPLRFTLIQKVRWAGGLRISPYFMIGDGSPAISSGGDLALLFDIALPKIFKIIVGPEVRGGFATVGNNNRISGYDGGSWINVGLESLLAGRFHVGAVFHGGAQWGSGGLGVDGVFRTNLYFGAKL